MGYSFLPWLLRNSFLQIQLQLVSWRSGERKWANGERSESDGRFLLYCRMRGLGWTESPESEMEAEEISGVGHSTSSAAEGGGGGGGHSTRYIREESSTGKGDHEDEFPVPIPIQTFLWRQTCPFIRPRLGKLHEATCVVISHFCNFF